MHTRYSFVGLVYLGSGQSMDHHIHTIIHPSIGEKAHTHESTLTTLQHALGNWLIHL